MNPLDFTFIVDAGVGKSIETWLTTQGYNVVSIITINPEMNDKEILELAISCKGIIITMDKDFGELVYKSRLPHSGVILLRLEDAVAEEKLAVIQSIIPEYLNKTKDSFSVYQDGKFRIRSKES